MVLRLRRDTLAISGMVIALCGASEGAAADPVGDYCSSLIDRMHFCMAAFFSAHKSEEAQRECEHAPDMAQGKYQAALDAVPADSPQRDLIAESYLALLIDLKAFREVKIDQVLTDEELHRLPPIVHKACD